jgi:hypothetical protein
VFRILRYGVVASKWYGPCGKSLSYMPVCWFMVSALCSDCHDWSQRPVRSPWDFVHDSTAPARPPKIGTVGVRRIEKNRQPTNRTKVSFFDTDAPLVRSRTIADLGPFVLARCLSIVVACSNRSNRRKEEEVQENAAGGMMVQ